jgi:tetratricopeptide (TPR) repeat protein
MLIIGRLLSRLSLGLGLVLGLSMPCLPAQEATVTIHFHSGPPRSGPVVAITATEIQIRPSDGATASLGFPYRSIRFIEFPPPPGWEEAQALLRQGDLDAAATRFERFAAARGAEIFHPAPGNFATLADRRLLDCYQRALRLPELANVADRIAWNQLPEEERDAQRLIPLWTAAAREQWDVVLALAEEADSSFDAAAPGFAVTGYLRGRAHEAQGRPDEAILAWGTTTGIFPGEHPHLAADALRRSCKLLAKLPERAAELRALLRIYRQSYGNGQLWEGAPPEPPAPAD